MRLRVPGDVDMGEFDRLNEEILKRLDLEPNEGLIADLTGTEYFGSAMLGLLVNLRQRAVSRGGRMALVHVSPRLHEVLSMSGLARLFTITRSLQAAVDEVV